MSRSNTWPGQIADASGASWNMLPKYALNLVPVDGGSVEGGISVALTATQLRNLQDEQQTAVSIYCGTQGSGGAVKELVIAECRPSGMFYCKGAIIQFNSSYLPWRHAKEGPWHYPDRTAGLKAIGARAPATVTLDEDAGLIDGDCATPGAGFPTTNTAWVCAGVQVGEKVDGVVYAPQISALAVLGAAVPVSSGMSIYGSDDNASWTQISGSALSGSGYSGGIAISTTGLPIGGNGLIVLFASEQNYCYYMLAWNNANGSTISIAEVIALSKYGDLSITQDYAHWRGIRIANAGAVSASGGVVSVAGVTKHRYEFPSDYPIVSARFKFRGMVFRTVSPSIESDAAGLAHMELYADASLIDFADADGLITSLTQTCQPGQTSTAVLFYIKNNHTLATTGLQLTIPIDAVDVTAQALAEEVTQNIPDSAYNLTKTGWILNEAGDGIGSLGDSSFSLDPVHCPGWTEVAAAPGATEYVIDYEAGTITTNAGTPIPLGATCDYKRAALGSMITEYSENGSDYVGIGDVLTFSSGVVAPGGLKACYARMNMETRTERVAMPALAHIQGDY